LAPRAIEPLRALSFENLKRLDEDIRRYRSQGLAVDLASLREPVASNITVRLRISGKITAEQSDDTWQSWSDQKFFKIQM